MKKILLSILLLSCTSLASAQSTSTFADAWFLVSNQYSIHEKWSLGNEIHWRSTHFLEDKEQFLIRPSITYQYNKSIGFSTGYTFIKSYPYWEEALPIVTPEHNVWEQLLIRHAGEQGNWSHRLRLEHRFRGQPLETMAHDYQIESYAFSHRFRYRISWKRSISQRWFVHVFDEFWTATVGDFSRPKYDRNWLYLGFGEQINHSGSIELAYLHQNIAKSDLQYERHPTVQLSLHYRLSNSAAKRG